MAVLDKLFKAGVDFNASDIHLAPGEPYVLRRVGTLQKLKNPKLSAKRCKALIYEILTEKQRKKLQDDFQLDFVYELPKLGRFRGSAMMHNSGLSASFRIIPPKIPSFEELHLPSEIINKILDNHQGLILVTGAAGQGKSTTLASMVDRINTIRAHHVLTVEDPIEFVHPLKKGVVNQRQLGTGTLSYGNALKAALREDPDVIAIGELRDLETTELAISASETGHLVIGTLSSSNAPKTIDRIIDSYPAGGQSQIRAMLSEAIKAVITQRLVPNKNGKNMELAIEILIGSVPVANLIRDNKVFQIPSMMQTGKRLGMRIMDESLLELVKEDKVAAEVAVQYANSANLFKAYMPKPETDQTQKNGEGQ
ncbi:PilT/PilU family type 4a pilus ATPase [Desulfococcaceae bacterium HSG7]|nr:PilT/PilU family type 4a pilus ATPase [Desulfococcaceae bacterium HSG7]